jgi:hypothetical protein
MRIVAVVLLTLVQFTVLPFFGKITANTVRQFRAATHEAATTTGATVKRQGIIEKAAEM